MEGKNNKVWTSILTSVGATILAAVVFKLADTVAASEAQKGMPDKIIAIEKKLAPLEDIPQIKSDLKELRTGFNSLDKNFSNMRIEVSYMKEDHEELKEDFKQINDMLDDYIDVVKTVNRR